MQCLAGFQVTRVSWGFVHPFVQVCGNSENVVDKDLKLSIDKFIEHSILVHDHMTGADGVTLVLLMHVIAF